MTILKHTILLRNTSPSPVNNLLSEQIHHQLLGQSVDHLPNDSGPVSLSANVPNGQQYSLHPAPVLEQFQPEQVIILRQALVGDGSAKVAENNPSNQASNSGLSSNTSSPFPPSIGSSIAFYPSSASSSPMTGDLLIDDRSRSSSLVFGQLDTQLSPSESTTSQVPSSPPPPTVPSPTDPAAVLTSSAAPTQQQSTATRQPGHNYGKFIPSTVIETDNSSV